MVQHSVSTQLHEEPCLDLSHSLIPNSKDLHTAGQQWILRYKILKYIPTCQCGRNPDTGHTLLLLVCMHMELTVKISNWTEVAVLANAGKLDNGEMPSKTSLTDIATIGIGSKALHYYFSHHPSTHRRSQSHTSPYFHNFCNHGCNTHASIPLRYTVLKGQCCDILIQGLLFCLRILWNYY